MSDNVTCQWTRGNGIWWASGEDCKSAEQSSYAPMSESAWEFCPYCGRPLEEVIPPPPMPAPVEARWTVRSSPSDAQVRVDGRYAGMTPLTLTDWTEGRHTLTLHAPGRKPWTQDIHVMHGDQKTLTAGLDAD